MDSGPRQKHYCESDFCTLSFLISRHHRGIAAQKPFPRRRAALGVRKPSKCRKRWFLANCGSSASLQPLEPGHSIDQKYTEGIGTTLTPRRLKCNAPGPAQSKRRHGQQEAPCGVCSLLFASGLKHISIYTGCGRRLWCARASAHLPNPAPSDGPGADGFAMPLELERLLLTGSSMSA